jgi:hypothetical protein
MTSYYLQTSEEIRSLTLQEKSWCERFLSKLESRGCLDFCYKLQQEEETDNGGGDSWTLWLYADENISEVMTGFVQRFLARHRPDQYVVLRYAAACGDPLPGEFGGGLIFITAGVVLWSDDKDWLAQQVAGFDRFVRKAGTTTESQRLVPLQAKGMTSISDRTYLFIVDTDRHAYPFHLALCAFLTGTCPLYGQCLDESQLVQRELLQHIANTSPMALDWTEETVLYLPTEDGIRVPAMCVPTPNWVIDRSGVAKHSPPDSEEGALPAYQSVAISFERPLSRRELEQLYERALLFAQSDLYEQEAGVPITILGYRLIEAVTVETCTAVFPEEY